MDELNVYQQAALGTAVYPAEQRIVYPALGLNGEAGEVAEKVKKVLRDNHGYFDEYQREQIALELGDVLWYVATLARDINYSLAKIAAMNVEKLRSRKQRGKIHGNGDNR